MKILAQRPTHISAVATDSTTNNQDIHSEILLQKAIDKYSISKNKNKTIIITDRQTQTQRDRDRETETERQTNRDTETE